MRVGVALAAALGASALFGCTQILGIEPWGAGGAGGSAGTGGSGGAGIGGGCGHDGFCVAAPPGWRGPVVLSDDGAPCGADYPREVAAGDTHLVAPPASCACACDPPAGATCSNPSVSPYDDMNCGGAPGAPTSLDTMCTPFAGTSNVMAVIVHPVTIADGTCDPRSTPDLPAVTFEHQRVCALAGDGDTCAGGGTCAPRPGSGLEKRLCIWTGELASACPAGDFVEKVDVHRGGFDDGRGCPKCGCGGPSGSCTATAVIYGVGACGGSPQVMATAGGGCTYVNGQGIASGRADITLDPGTCAPDDPAPPPTGSVDGRDTVTVCCTTTL